MKSGLVLALLLQGLQYVPLPESAPVSIANTLLASTFTTLVSNLRDGDMLLLLSVNNITLTQDTTISASILLHGKISATAGECWFQVWPDIVNRMHS